MAHIRKLKNGTYQAVVYVGTSAELDKHGKPKKIYEYYTAPTQKEAKAWARDLETEIENNTYSNLGRMRFSAWADKWMELNFVDYSIPDILEKTKPKYKPSTQKSYKMYINYHFVPFFGHMFLKDIQEIHIKEYIAKKTKDGLASSTIKKHFYILSDILYDALKIKNPCRDVEPPKIKPYVPEILEKQDFNLLREALKNTWDEIPLLLAAWCGLRLGEIFCLKPEDIDSEKCLITVDETRAISEYGYIDVDPKSVRGLRTIPVPQVIIELIKKWRLQQKEIKKYIFPMRPDSYSKRFSTIIDRHNDAIKRVRAKKAKRSDFILTGRKRCIEFNLAKEPIPDIRFHDLRHYHATLLYNNGFSDQYASARLGHDISVLKKIYQHLDRDTTKKEDERLKELLNE